MRFCRPFLVAALFAAMPSLAAGAVERAEPDIDMYAHISGKCTTLKIAGRDFGCKAVAYFHGQQGRAHFTIVLDDPRDDSHIVSFSGETGRREQDNIYELQVDRMLLNSSDRPKVDGLPVPLVESSTGTCRQVGIIATRQVSSISCVATVRDGRKYELQFVSDGEPVTLRRIRQSALSPRKRRTPRRPSNSNAAARPMSPRCCRATGPPSSSGAWRTTIRSRRRRSSGDGGVDPVDRYRAVNPVVNQAVSS